MTGPRRQERCPKSMRHGPCGGAGDDGGCEVPGLRCPFMDEPGPVVPDSTQPSVTAPLTLPSPLLVDFRPDPSLEWELAEACALLAERGVVALIGDHLDDPTPHAPSVVAAAVHAHDVPVVSTLTCRNRTIGEIQHQLERLQSIDPVAVHCLTGDHPAARLGLEQPASFALDSFELLGLAGAWGLARSVAESPAAAPQTWRPARLAAKAAAGAGLAVLNHGGGPAAMVAFADAVAALHGGISLVAPVPVIADRRSAEALARFPGLVLPDGFIDSVLSADDPTLAGRAAAVELASTLLSSGRFAAVNLSGAAIGAGVVARTELMADVIDAVLAEVG